MADNDEIFDPTKIFTDEQLDMYNKSKEKKIEFRFAHYVRIKEAGGKYIVVTNLLDSQERANSKLYYEYTTRQGDTLKDLAIAFGYNETEWSKFFNLPINAKFKAASGKGGDSIPTGWVIYFPAFPIKSGTKNEIRYYPDSKRVLVHLFKHSKIRTVYTNWKVSTPVAVSGVRG